MPGDAARQALKSLGKIVGQTAALMCGQPDYDTYVAHMVRTHPDQNADDPHGILPQPRGPPVRGGKQQRVSLLLTLSANVMPGLVPGIHASPSRRSPTVIDKPAQSVLPGEVLNDRQISGHAVGLVGDDVDPSALDARMLDGVDARDKPGHDGGKVLGLTNAWFC